VGGGKKNTLVGLPVRMHRKSLHARGAGERVLVGEKARFEDLGEFRYSWDTGRRGRAREGRDKGRKKASASTRSTEGSVSKEASVRGLS